MPLRGTWLTRGCGRLLGTTVKFACKFQQKHHLVKRLTNIVQLVKASQHVASPANARHESRAKPEQPIGKSRAQSKPSELGQWRTAANRTCRWSFWYTRHTRVSGSDDAVIVVAIVFFLSLSWGVWFLLCILEVPRPSRFRHELDEYDWNRFDAVICGCFLVTCGRQPSLLLC